MLESIRTAVCSAVFFLFSNCFGAVGQILPEWVVRMIENECEGGTKDPEEMGLYFLDLMRKPMDLNTAGRERLSEFPLLTPFMVESLMDYREEYGYVTSYAELSLVDGFDSLKVERMIPFVTIGNPLLQQNVSGRPPEVSNSVILRSRISLKRSGEDMYGSPFYRYLRYGIEVGDVARAGVTAESDPGEKGFPDFASVFLEISGIPLSADGRFGISRIVAGDYSMRFGQGLALWTGFSMNSLSQPSSVIRNNPGVRSYTSSGESGFFRGGAATLKLFGKIGMTVFVSSRYRDGRIEGDSFVTMPEDGMHDSDRAIEAKWQLKETAGGVNVSMAGKSFRMGITALAYGFDKKDGRKKSYYNDHISYDGTQFNLAADFVVSVMGSRIFGEVAVDRGLHLAAIAGAVYPVSSEWEFSVSGRYYDYRYVAMYSGAYCNSSCNNEAGGTVVLRYAPGRNLLFTAGAAYTYYPHHRFGVRGPSDVLKVSAECDWSLSEHHNLHFRTSYSADNGKESSVFRLRGEYTFSLNPALSLISRLETSLLPGDWGMLAYAELRYAGLSGKLRCAVRASCFSAEEWASRIYCYEMGIPGTFSVPAYYGKGTGLYAVVTYKPVRWFSASMKCSGAIYSDRARDNLRLNLQLNLLF